MNTQQIEKDDWWNGDAATKEKHNKSTPPIPAKNQKLLEMIMKKNNKPETQKETKYARNQPKREIIVPDTPTSPPMEEKQDTDIVHIITTEEEPFEQDSLTSEPNKRQQESTSSEEIRIEKKSRQTDERRENIGQTKPINIKDDKTHHNKI